MMHESDHNLNRRGMFPFLRKEPYKNKETRRSKAGDYLPQLQTHYTQIPLLLKREHTLQTGGLTADH